VALSPTYNLPSEEELLDWGSEDKVCILTSPNLHNVHNLLASLQPLKGITLLKDGSCKHSSKVSTFSIDPYCIMKCEHGDPYTLCSKCKGKLPSEMGSMWLLDSGMSAHFIYKIKDFIEYTPFKLSEQSPIATASNVIYIEGKGTILLKHKVDNKLVTTHLYPVLYIPKLMTYLISIGEFLQQGLHISGDYCSIFLLSKHETIISCKPIFPGQTVY
jgi:hypothetical protein